MVNPSTDDVAGYLGVSVEETWIPGVLNAAIQAVDGFLRPSGVARCPQATRDLAILATTGNLNQRRLHPDGIAQWSPDGSVARLAGDVLAGVPRNVLARYRGFGVVG